MKPSIRTQTPGVVARKLSVGANIPTAAMLPAAEARGASGRSAMRAAIASSATPIRRLAPATSSTA